jgi:hypothetical protein
MCNLGAEEDILHLFFDCPFAQSYWQTLQIQWNNDSNLIPKLIHARVHNNHILFMEIFFGGCLGIVEAKKCQDF